MAGPLAPTLESQAYIEQPIAPPSTSVGSLFAGFLRDTAPSKSSSTPSADREFADAISQALQISGDPDKGGPEAAAKVARAAVLRLASFGDITPDQAAIAAQFGVDADAVIGINPEQRAREEFMSSVEGQTYLQMARTQLKDQGIEADESQVENYAFRLRTTHGATDALLEAERDKINLGLIADYDVVKASITKDMDIMVAAMDRAFEDGIVTEAERREFRTQFEMFAGTKYNEYRSVMPMVDQTLSSMSRLVDELSKFDEAQVAMDSARSFLSQAGYGPVETEFFMNALKKGSDPSFFNVDLKDMMDAAKAVGAEGIAHKSIFMSTDEISREISAAANSTSTDAASVAQREQHVRSFVRGTLELNSGDIPFDSTDTKASFFNQSMGMLIIVAEQDDTLLPRVERSMLTDESFLANITRFSQVEPVRGEELVIAYGDALRSELTNMDNQIKSALDPKFSGVLQTDTKDFSINFDTLREAVKDDVVSGVPLVDVVGLVEQKVKEAGGVQNYLNMSALRQQVRLNENAPFMRLDTLLGLSSSKDIKRIFELSPERSKLQNALGRVSGLEESLGLISSAQQTLDEGDIEAPASTARFVDTTDAPAPTPLEAPQGEQPLVNEGIASAMERGKSSDNPQIFGDLKDADDYRKRVRALSVGSFFRDPRSGAVYEVIRRADNEVLVRNPETGQQYKIGD